MFVNSLFLGQIVATPASLSLLAEYDILPIDLLSRHLNGDWGDLDSEDKERNNLALLDGARISSAYVLAEGVKVWVITEAKDDNGCRSATTILLPDEY